MKQITETKVKKIVKVELGKMTKAFWNTIDKLRRKVQKMEIKLNGKKRNGN